MALSAREAAENGEKTSDSDFVPETSVMIESRRYGGDRGWLSGPQAETNFVEFATRLECLIHSGNEGWISTFLENHFEQMGGTKGVSIERMAILLCELGERLVSADQHKIWPEVVLTAVSMGNRCLVEALLQTFPKDWDLKLSTSSLTFPAHMTPLLLASINNNFALVQCLLSLGHHIEPPHRHDCGCEECFEHAKSTDFQTKQLDTYRAVASPAFIWMGTRDPFMACVDLVRDLGKCARTATEHAIQYHTLMMQVRKLSTEIVEHCANSGEISTLLMNKSGCYIADAQFTIPRLRPALDAGLKETLSHPLVQSQIVWEWKGGLRTQRVNVQVCCKKEDTWISISLQFWWILLAACYPVWAVLVLCSRMFGCHCDVLRTPMLRFVAHTSSYLTFVSVLLFHKFYHFGYHIRSSRPDSSFRFYLEIIIYCYALSYLTQNLYFFIRKGPSTYFATWWSWFDFLMLSFFALSFYCWMCFQCEKKRGVFDVNRRHLDSLDNYLMFEMMLNVAVFLCVWRMLYFLQLSKTFGRFIVSCFRCVKEYLMYIVIVAFIFLSFAIAQTGLFRPYSVTVEEKRMGLNKDNGYHYSNYDIPQTLNKLFLAFFGMVEEEYAQLNPGFAGPEQSPIPQSMAAFLGHFTTGVFFVVMVLTLSNIMVSLMVAIAEAYQSKGDEEWRFERLNLYHEYFLPGTVYPPPFNVLHLIYLFCELSAYVIRGGKNKSDVFWNGPFPIQFTHFISQKGRAGNKYECSTGATTAVLLKNHLKKDFKPIAEELLESDKYAHLMLTLFYRYMRSREAGVTDPFSVLSSRKGRESAKFAHMVLYEKELQKPQLGPDEIAKFWDMIELQPSPTTPQAQPAPPTGLSVMESPRIR